MSRKPKKGYFVRGQFVAEGSELDLEYKRELKGGFDGPSRTELKRESTELQDLGTELLTLRRDLMEGLALPDKLVDAETMEVVITMLNDMGVAVYEQTPDAETLLITNTGPTVASEEEAEEEAEAARHAGE